MKLNAYDQISLFDDLKPEWNELVARSTSNRIFSTWEWAFTWWQAYEPGKLWVITCRTDDNQLLGIAPLFIAENDEHKRIVSIIGCKEVTDYLDLIIDADYVDQVTNCFSLFLRDHSELYDQIEFCNLPQESITYKIFPSALKHYQFETQTDIEDVCPIIELPDTWDEYLSMLDKKQRHELRRKLRRSQGVNTDMDWYIVGEEHNLEEEMEHFLRLMAASEPAKKEFLANPENAAFFKALAPVLFAKGWLQLIFLTVDGERAATYLNFDYANQILVYNSGLLPEEYGQLSPGIVLLANNIRYSIENKRSTFDFLQGDETYKYHMGGKDTFVHNLVASLS